MTEDISRYPQRVHNELRFRELIVLRVERVSAGSQRIVLGGDTPDGFTLHGFDDHTEVFFPEPGSNSIPPVVTDEGIAWADGVRSLSCDYTPLYDEAHYELALDFYIHDGDMADTWAMNVREGDKLMINEPCGSLVIPEDYTCQACVYDESGIPALRRRLESLSRSAVRPYVMALVNVQDTAYQDCFARPDGFTLQWFIGHDEQTMNEHPPWLSMPADDYPIWTIGEGKVAKNPCVRFETEAFDQQRVRAVAYWHQRR